MNVRLWKSAALAAALVTAASRASAAVAPARPTVDATLSARASAATLAELDRLSHDPAMTAIGTPKHIDEGSAVPSFLVATRGSETQARVGATTEEAARQDLQRLAPYYRLSVDDVQNAPLRYVNETGDGAIVAVFRQEIDGIPVMRDEIKVLLDRQRNLIAVGGSIPPRAAVTSHLFRLQLTDAIAIALTDLAGAPIGKGALRHVASKPGGYELFDAPGATAAKLTATPIRARRVFFRVGEALVPAYHVELTARDEEPTYVLAADDGRVLLRHDRVAHESYNYRVYADATGLKLPLDGPEGTSASPYPTALPSNYDPPPVAAPLVALQNGPISTNDPWLPPGATVTTGNNADVFAQPGDDPNPKTRATITSANTFDRMFDVNQEPNASANQQMAAVTNLFYVINFLHDWYYDAGFTEAAGNSQASNYGRGGIEGDPIIAKTQLGETFNAYMGTPADGASATMYHYLWWFGPYFRVRVNSPASLAGDKPCSRSENNPTSFDLTAPLVLPNPGTFTSTRTTLTVGSSPRFAQISDVNGDGWPDLIVSNASSNNVGVMLNNGAGGFAPQVTYATGNVPRMTVTPDLNHDGLPDLVSANQVGGNITIRLGTGGGAFGASTALASANGANSIAVGRFNNDANDDIVVGNAASNDVSVFLGNGAGSFAPRVPYTMSSTPISVAVGDVDNDGNADIVAANFGTGEINMAIRLGTGTGTFGALVTDTIGNNPQGIALADLNGDGKLDAIASNTGNSTVSVALGNGDGTFATPVFSALPAAPIGVAAADFNGDGIIDVLATHGVGSGAVSLLANNGAGVLGVPQTISTGGNTPQGVTLGDVTGDGNPDILVANSGSGTVAMLTGTVTPSTSFCAPFTNTLTGRIVEMPFSSNGACVQGGEAVARGAAGVLFDFSGSLLNFYGPSTIPALGVSTATGQAMRAALRAGTPVNVNFSAGNPLRRDGALDIPITAHEWTHQLSWRLLGDASGFTSAQSYCLGEGWSDFGGLLLMVRPEDVSVPSNANWEGAYAIMGHVLSNNLTAGNSWWFGNRRYPYSTDFAKNPLTFRHIQDGEPLPSGPPLQNNGAPNSEAHAAGEVWCNTLWECYAALLRDTGRLTFDQARDRMRRYFVQSLQMTPLGPNFLEARDALLAVAAATDPQDEAAFCAAFARRGMGTNAVCPDRNAGGNIGVTESYACVGDMELVSVAADDSIHSCDHDNIVDGTEDGHLVLTFRGRYAPVGPTTATVTCSNPNLVFPLGNVLNVPGLSAGSVSIGKLQVHRNGINTQVDHLYVQYGEPSYRSGARMAKPFTYGNVDEAPSATDGFSARTSYWTAGWTKYPAITSWGRIQPDSNALNRYQRAGDPYVVSERTLTSPPLHVGAGNFSFTFQTAYALDYDTSNGPMQDGGVVEISANDGTSWSDLGSAMSPGYSGAIASSTNPLHGRMAFGRVSPSYPNFSTVTVGLGTAYAGKTVRIRFLLATDGSPGFGAGYDWRIDNVSFTGLTDLPFTSVAGQMVPCQLTGIDDPAVPAVLAFAAEGANPSRGAPTFRFDLPKPAHVLVALYDVGGRRVATLANGDYDAGVFHASWSGMSASGERHPGVYFARMVADGQSIARRVVVLGP